MISRAVVVLFAAACLGSAALAEPLPLIAPDKTMDILQNQRNQLFDALAITETRLRLVIEDNTRQRGLVADLEKKLAEAEAKLKAIAPPAEMPGAAPAEPGSADKPH